jgi:hypothetical protein
VYQSIRALGLDHEAPYSGLERVTHNLLSGQVAQQDHPDSGDGTHDLFGCFQTVQNR